MIRRLALGAATLTLILGIAACQPVDGGAGGSETPQASTAESMGASPAESMVAPAAPSDAAEESPIATMGTDNPY